MPEIPDLFAATDDAPRHGETVPRKRPAAPATTPDTAARRHKPGAMLPAPVREEWLALAARLPAGLHLGTSSWSFPGWKDLVFGADYSETRLSRNGLAAYGQHPLLRGVGIDRGFYAPVPLSAYADYASQVPDDFRFLVKGPASVCDALVRDSSGRGMQVNPTFLDPERACCDFIEPASQGLGMHCGPLVFQCSPMPGEWMRDVASVIARLRDFFAALPRPDPGLSPDACLALEVRDPELLTPRLVRMLAAAGVRYCVGVHARLPAAARQARALAMLDAESPGALVVRWSLHSGFRYEQARERYAPFNQIVDIDPETRATLADLAASALRRGQRVHIIVNNKAEGSAPLSCFALAQGIADILEAE